MLVRCDLVSEPHEQMEICRNPVPVEHIWENLNDEEENDDDDHDDDDGELQPDPEEITQDSSYSIGECDQCGAPTAQQIDLNANVEWDIAEPEFTDMVFRCLKCQEKEEPME